MNYYFPKYEAESAWVGHLPFAFWLIKNMRPKVFVELGTHRGSSYFSFCESVCEHGLMTKCFAVDTWEGDEHTHAYENVVYDRVNEYNLKTYSSFSNLLKMTFDEALDSFSAFSIDLLHIDGYHTYEAVRHDFTTWLPKMAKDGVILFHDIAVKSHDFGVYKLWAEIQSDYKHTFSFSQSHGLGVLFLGDTLPRYLRDIFHNPSSDILNYLKKNANFVERGYKYELLDENLASALQDNKETHAQLASALQDNKETHAQLASALQDNKETHAQLASVLQDNKETHAQLASVLQDNDSTHSKLNEVTQELIQTHERLRLALQS